MHDFFEKQPDALDDLLRPAAAPPEGAALRDDLREQTTRLLRQRRRLRRLARLAALAACYLVGLLTMHWVRPPAVPPRPLIQGPDVSRPAKKPAPPAEPESALAVEWKALDADGPGRELYQQAGDLYLREDNDIGSALRCYGNALDAGTDADRAVAAEDSWLLMTIKDARQKEKRHAKTGG